MFALTFVLLVVIAVLLMAWIGAMDRADGYMPSRRQRREWARARLVLPNAKNRRVS